MFDLNTQMQLRELRLQEMVDIIEGQEKVPEYLSMSFESRFQYLVSDFYCMKMKEKNEKLLKRAHLKYPKAVLSDIIYTPERGLDRNLIIQLSTGNFINYATNIAIFGPTRTGKTFIASALAHMSCMLGKSTLYVRVPDLISDYCCKETPKQKVRFINKIAKYDLLVLDEWLCDTYDDPTVSFLFEVFEKRENAGATILCSQYSPTNWKMRLGESAKTQSLLSRIVSGMCIVECKDLDITKLECCKVKI